MSSPETLPTFSICREYIDENGIWNPRDRDKPIEDGFQVNVFGRKEHYLALADAIRDFALKDTSEDSEYHEHIEGLESVDRKVRFHLIARKDDVGESIQGS